MHSIDSLASTSTTTGDDLADAGVLIHLPGTEGYDAARGAFNVLVDQRPAAIALPTSADEVADAVRWARGRGLRIAPQATGHNAAPLGDLSGSLLLRTDRMRGVSLDPARGIARVEAGARWEDVVAPAEALGFMVLHGSSPDVSVTGYSLGGGLGWLARRHGLQANQVTAIELVDPEANELRASDSEHPDLFWALRGGGGAFGVVTALEFRMVPTTDLYAGMMLFPWERSAEVLRAWLDLLPGFPDELTSVGRILQIPDMPDVPPPLRARAFVAVEAAFLGAVADGEALLAPLRALGPELDTFAAVPPSALAELHMDPRSPVPAASTHAMLGHLSTQGLDELIAVAGPGSGSPLTSVELRHCGGALARAAEGHGARDALGGELAMFAVGIPATPELAAAVAAALGAVRSAVAPFEVGTYLNFAEQPVDPGDAFSRRALARLRAIKAAVDPADAMHANHPVR